MSVAAILAQKGPDIVSVTPATVIAEVLHVLSRHDIGAVLVMDEATMVGLISERDIARTLARVGAATLDMPAGDVMTRNLVVASPNTTAIEALQMMSSGRFRHLPVKDGNALCGFISIGDVVKHRFDQQECEVDNLRAYVIGAI